MEVVMKSVCSNCKKEFDVKLEEQYLGAMLTEIYFICPQCNHKYLVGIENNKCRRIQREIDIVNKRLKYKYSEELVLKQKELTQMLKKEMDRINGKT